MVFVTIGYFDVVGSVQLTPTVSIPQLGAETFITVPGDMRQKFEAVVDMSNMALKANPQDPDPNPIAVETPFFTSLESSVYENSTDGANATLNIPYSSYIPGVGVIPARLFVTADGNEVEVLADGLHFLAIGHGVDQQIVSIQQILGPGQILVTTAGLVAANFKTTYAGTCISNVRPGDPGVQPGFSYTDPKYNAVLPYIERLK
jgi:hypothetical protein